MKQHANHGRDHLEDGMDPSFHPKHMLIVLAHDFDSFTYLGNGVTAAFMEFHVPPDLDGWYLIDARAEVSDTTDAGDIEFDIKAPNFDWYLLNDGADGPGVLLIEADTDMSATAKASGSVTTYQLTEGERFRIRCVTAPDPNTATGAKVWLKFGKSPADGALAPVPD